MTTYEITARKNNETQTETTTSHSSAKHRAGWLRNQGWKVRVEKIDCPYCAPDELCAIHRA